MTAHRVIFQHSIFNALNFQALRYGLKFEAFTAILSFYISEMNTLFVWRALTFVCSYGKVNEPKWETKWILSIILVKSFVNHNFLLRAR